MLWFFPILGGSLSNTNVIFNPKSLETKTNQPSVKESETQASSNFPTSESILPSMTTESVDAINPDPSPIPSQGEEPISDPTHQPAQTPVCNGPEAMSILVVGLDKRIQSDAIRMVRVDFIDSTVSILSIPRDFYVPIVDMGAYGITEGRINATYGYGETLLGTGKGITSLTYNLTYNFGVSFDHYLLLHLDDITNYIDKVGGVDIHLDQPVSDGWSNFASGDHHFDGETAVIFMRMRLYDDDFARVRRQTMVLKAFFKKATSDPVSYTHLTLPTN